MGHFSLVFIILFLSGCTTPPVNKSCDKDLVVVQAKKDKAVDQIKEVKHCKKDKKSHWTGQSLSLATYCSDSVAYFHGKENITSYNNKLCPKDWQQSSLQSFERGQKLHALIVEKKAIDTKIESELADLSKDKTLIDEISHLYEFAKGSSPIVELKKKRALLGSKILKLELQSPPTQNKVEFSKTNLKL